ncbi:LytR/AlgR family response regulator transcription factor [Flavihumibacter profundi]|uniref:LytR/AlgR family response regulator transcription factor n=1 Tax=Flavihumibacter profundi TaxID=2716883 RepID=UPI001CC8275E|nr:response regulator [Flavihumibacter profundi]MBZ5857176.1 response regulator [Flavihumibacter profundi]
MIRAIIIDDEPYCCEALATMLEDYCPEVEILGTYHNSIDGLAAIRQKSPDLVFLDVEMPKMNGFDMLAQLPTVNFEIIFTTSYDQYALKAIRFSAIDYLLKPVDQEELVKAVQKVIQRSQKPIAQQLEILLQKIHNPSTPISKMAMPTMEGLQMIQVNQIISCESDSNYTILHLKDKKRKVVSSTLKEIEELLEEHSFLRVHRCYLVNLNEIEKYMKGEGGFLVMSDGSTVDVSRGKKELLLKKLLPG